MQTHCPHCDQRIDAPDGCAGPSPPPPPPNTPPGDRRPTDGFGLAALGLLVAALTLAACLIVIADGRTPDPAAVMIGLVGGLGLFGAGLIVWSLGQIRWKLDQLRRDIAQK